MRTAKADATRTAARLDKLENRAQVIADQIAGEVTQVASVKGQLVDRRSRYASARSQKFTVLASTRDDRHALEGDLRSLEAEQSKIQAQLAAASSGGGGGSGVAGPVRTGSGGLIWPVNGPIVSPFGMRWGRLHAGVDIAVPSGTPVHAAQSGRVAIAGWVGGYGNYTCIQHSGGLSTCYGHQSSIGVSVGQSVSQGRSSAPAAAPATASARTCTSRRASTARRSIRPATCRAPGRRCWRSEVPS